MYIRYIHKLYDLHLKAQNYTGTSGPTAKASRALCVFVCYLLSSSKQTDRCFCLCAHPPSVSVSAAEASYTLLLYDELLEWSDRPLREFLNYPMQSEWQRKEYLHLTIIQNFDRGKVSGRGPIWEKQNKRKERNNTE